MSRIWKQRPEKKKANYCQLENNNLLGYNVDFSFLPSNLDTKLFTEKEEKINCYLQSLSENLGKSQSTSICAGICATFQDT